MFLILLLYWGRSTQQAQCVVFLAECLFKNDSLIEWLGCQCIVWHFIYFLSDLFALLVVNPSDFCPTLAQFQFCFSTTNHFNELLYHNIYSSVTEIATSKYWTIFDFYYEIGLGSKWWKWTTLPHIIVGTILWNNNFSNNFQLLTCIKQRLSHSAAMAIKPTWPYF